MRAFNELTTRVADIRQAIHAHESWEAASRGVAERQAQRAARVEVVERAVCEQELRADEAADAHAAIVSEIKVLQACRDALGPRGARVRILSDALTGVQDVASAWLERFYDGAVRCELRLDEESREKGQRAGSIALNIVGLGSGGYKSLSGGQRRRVDLALQFALAEVSALASGRAPGTLWVDEAFDALDVEGVAAVQTALEDVAQDRCVVVISHSQHVVEGMRFDQHVKLGGS
jgi:DNA repair exonuclease SbcCD ATPase subunit